MVKKEVYSRNVIFIEVGGTSRDEEVKREKTKNQELEINGKCLDLGDSTKSDKESEQQTLNVRRSS